MSNDRRGFLRAAWLRDLAQSAAGEGETEIASVVVHAIPARIGEVAEAIAAIAEAEIAATDPRGKLVVALEAPAGGRLGEVLNQLSLLPGVVAATLVYHAVQEGTV